MPNPPLHVILLGPHEVADRTYSLSKFTNLVYEQLQLKCVSVERQHFINTVGNGIRGKSALLLERMLLFPRRLQKRIAALQRQSPESKIVLHATDESVAYYGSRLRHHRLLWSCHDLFQVHRYTDQDTGRITNWFYRRLLDTTRHVDHIICISSETKRDLLQTTGLSPTKVSTVPLALNYPFRPMPIEQARQRLRPLLPTRYPDSWPPFFIHVGANYPRKNRLGLARIFRHLKDDPAFADHFLFTAGKGLSTDVKSYIEVSGLAPWVVSLENITDEDLRALYSAAEALVFPSLQEGYGWPLVEAQACGCPVFATNRPPMTEVGADAAVYFDPQDEAAAARTIAANIGRREEMTLNGLNNAARFSQSAMADAFLAIYKRIP